MKFSVDFVFGTVRNAIELSILIPWVLMNEFDRGWSCQITDERNFRDERNIKTAPGV